MLDYLFIGHDASNHAASSSALSEPRRRIGHSLFLKSHDAVNVDLVRLTLRTAGTFKKFYRPPDAPSS